MDDIGDLQGTVNQSHKAAQRSLTQAKLLLLETAREIRKCPNDGPLGALHQALAALPEAVNARQQQVSTTIRKTRKQLGDLKKEAKAIARNEAEAKAKEQVVEWDARRVTLEETAVDEVAKAELLTKEALTELEPVDMCIASASAAIQKAQDWCDEVSPDPQTNIPVLSTFRRSLGTFRTALTQLSRKVEVVKEKRAELDMELFMNARVQIGVALRNYIKSKELTVDAIFREAPDMDYDTFMIIIKDAEATDVDERFARRVFSAFGDVITPEEFTFIAEPRFRVIKATALTDINALKNSKNVARVSDGDIVDCLGLPALEEESKAIRMKAAFQGAEGYVTLVGNAGSTFLTLYRPAFVVKVETVMTNMFEMKGFKVLRRLKLGEILKTCATPRTDNTGLVRIHGVMSSDGTEGWVTVLGNQGISYLENCDRPEKIQAEQPQIEECPEDAPQEDAVLEDSKVAST